MDWLKRISQVFAASEEIPFDDASRYIIMSDCHRGDGNWYDEFSKNQNLYFAALSYYYKEGYTYIEIGDGDELWENRKFSDILQVHKDVFWLLSRFFEQNRLYFIYGNHDIEKKDKRFVKENLHHYYDERKRIYRPLFKNIKFHEGLILRNRTTGHKIHLIHGHQVDFFNDDLWLLSKYLVRCLWKPLAFLGVNDPTRTAKNYEKKEFVARRLTEWVIQEKQMLIAGHNHRPAFSEVGQPPYFNDGSCVHPRCITGIEITGGSIALIKWSVKTRSDGTMFIGRDILAGPRKLRDYFYSSFHALKYSNKEDKKSRIPFSILLK